MVISSTIKVITMSSSIRWCIGKCILINGSRHIIRPIFSSRPMMVALTHKLRRVTMMSVMMVMTISLTMMMVSWIGIPIFPTRIIMFPILVKHACSAWFTWRLSSSASFRSNATRSWRTTLLSDAMECVSQSLTSTYIKKAGCGQLPARRVVSIMIWYPEKMSSQFPNSKTCLSFSYLSIIPNMNWWNYFPDFHNILRFSSDNEKNTLFKKAIFKHWTLTNFQRWQNYANCAEVQKVEFLCNNENVSNPDF